MKKNQDGFGLVQAFIVLLILCLVAIIVFRIASTHRTTAKNTGTITATKPTKIAAKSADPTVDWPAYTNSDAKYSLKYPKTWATAAHPELCDKEIFMLGTDADSVGKCASEGSGQITFVWRPDRNICGDLGIDAWTQDSKEAVTVDGLTATKITATAKAPDEGLGAYPEGTKTVQYCAVNNGATYIADYVQLSSYPDVLNELNTIVTKTFKFN